MNETNGKKQTSFSEYKFFLSKNSESKKVEENNNKVDSNTARNEKYNNPLPISCTKIDHSTPKESDYETIENTNNFSLILKDLSSNSSPEILRDAEYRVATPQSCSTFKNNMDTFSNNAIASKNAYKSSVQSGKMKNKNIYRNPLHSFERKGTPPIKPRHIEEYRDKYQPLDIVKKSSKINKNGLTGQQIERGSTPDSKWMDSNPAQRSGSSSKLKTPSTSSHLNIREKKTSTPIDDSVHGESNTEKIKIKNLFPDISTIKKPISPKHRKERKFLSNFKRETSYKAAPISFGSNKERQKIHSFEQTISNRNMSMSFDTHNGSKTENSKIPQLHLSTQTTNDSTKAQPTSVVDFEENLQKSKSNENFSKDLHADSECSFKPTNPGQCNEYEICSDEDIVMLDKNGEKMPNLGAEKTRKLKMKYETKDAESILCEYNRHVITAHDYKTLKDGEYLNDNIVDFYLSYIHENNLSHDKQEFVHIYSSHFYSRLKGSPENQKIDKSLAQTKNQAAYLRVKSWTRKINIFSKRMLIFPICEEEHWYLIVVCNAGQMQFQEKKDICSENKKSALYNNYVPCIIVLDSVGSSHRKAVGKIRSYLQYEHEEREGNFLSFQRMSSNSPVIPFQPNSCDCGVYLLQYVEMIFKDIRTFLENSEPNLSQWFSSEEVDSKREEIAILIQTITKQKYALDDKVRNEQDWKNIFPQIPFKGIERKKRATRVHTRWDAEKKEHSSNLSENEFEETKKREPVRKVYFSSEQLVRSKPFLEEYKQTMEEVDDNKLSKSLSRVESASGYDTSDNMKYFGNIKTPSLVSRIGNAFGEHSIKVNNTSKVDVVRKLNGISAMSKTQDMQGRFEESTSKTKEIKSINRPKFRLAQPNEDKDRNLLEN